MFVVKLKPNSSLERYKSRLITKSYDQLEGLDDNETFSLVVKQVTIGLDANIDWKLGCYIIGYK